MGRWFEAGELLSDPRWGWAVALCALLVLFAAANSLVRQFWARRQLDSQLRDQERSLDRARANNRRLRQNQAQTQVQVATSPDARAHTPFIDGLDRSRTFEVLGRLSHFEQLPELFREIVRSVGEEFGFERAVLRVYNPQTRLFEARAFHGCDDELIARISTTDVSVDCYAGMAQRSLRIGSSYRVSALDERWPDRLRLAPSNDGSASNAGWQARDFQTAQIQAEGDDDYLVVPMLGEEDRVVGYFCVAMPEEHPLPGENTLMFLEILAHYAVSALSQARLRNRLQRRDIEYSIISEQLREWQSTRDNFVANVSHELRTPLTSIRAYAETLQRGRDNMDASTMYEFVDVILNESERLARSFDDLLDVAQYQGGSRSQVVSEFDLAATVSARASACRQRMQERGLEFRVDIPTDAVTLQGDETGLRQVVDNLLDNAIKFTPAKGEVRLSLTEGAGVARIEVEDTGIGMPEPELSKIFERFYQVDDSSTRNYGGQGLGLAICREIISWHHGRIWAERRRTGGIRFVVTVPVRGLAIRRSSADLPADVSERQQWEAFLQLSVSLVSEMLDAHVASIMLVDSSQEVLRIEAALGLPQEVVEGVLVGRGEGVAGHVWRTGESLLVENIDEDERFRGLSNEVAYGHRSFLSVPLLWQEHVIGVVNVNNHPQGRPFTTDDRLLLEALAERVCGALDSFERYRSGYRRLASVEAGVRAMLDVGRERHTALRDVLVAVGLETARRMELGEEHLRALAYALRTYDLGLAQVSEQILRKISPLTNEERRHIENHVQLGAELVGELEPSPRVRNIILHHHENFDGSGYPEGLRGEAIPVGARIVRLVDALSALLHDRPFRSAMSLEEAISLLEEGVTRRFCPRVAPIFLSLVRERESDLLATHSRRGHCDAEAELELLDAHPTLR